MITKLKRFIGRLRGTYPPVIQTEWGPVTETYRLQAAMNMKNIPEKKKAVEELLISQCGGNREMGLAKARKQFPEAYD